MSARKLTPVEKDTYLLVARFVREGPRKLTKQQKLNVRVDEAQLTLLAKIADAAQAAAMAEVQPDLFSRDSP